MPLSAMHNWINLNCNENARPISPTGFTTPLISNQSSIEWEEPSSLRGIASRIGQREKARLGSAATERITHFPGCPPLCFIRVGSDKTDGRGILLVCRLKSARLVCAWSLTSITRLERDTASTEVIGPRKWRCVKVKPGRMDARLRQATSRSRKANEWPRIIPGLCSPLNAPKDLDAQHPHLHRYALTTFSPRPVARPAPATRYTRVPALNL